MDTSKIKLHGKNEKKAGKNNTQTILTAAGAMVVGGVSGAAIDHELNNETPVKPHSEKPENSLGMSEEHQSAQTEQHPQEEQQSQAEQHVAQNSGSNNGGQTEIQPTNNGNTVQPTPQHEPQPNPGGAAGGQDVDPQEVAQNIGIAQVDPEDIDTPDVVAVDGFQIIYDENGNEVSAALVHTPDGVQFVLADADGDGVYEGIYGMDGSFVTYAEASLTHSDLETMIDQTGGFLALGKEDVIEQGNPGEDPIGDIINTEDGTHVNIAQYTPTNSGQSSGGEVEPVTNTDEDELLAQLLGGDPSKEDDIALCGTPDPTAGDYPATGDYIEEESSEEGICDDDLDLDGIDIN